MTLCAPRRSWTRTSTGWPPCARNMGRRSKPSPGRRWKRGPSRRARAWRLARERETLEGLRRELAQAASNLGLLQDQVGRDQQDEAELRTLEQQAQAAAERLRQSEAPLARALQQRDAQRAAADAARLALTAAGAADRRDLEQQLRQLDADTERLDGALKAADELIARIGAQGRGGRHRSAGRRSAGTARDRKPARQPARPAAGRGHAAVVPIGAGRAGAAGRPRTGGRRATAADGGGGAGTARRGLAAHRAGRQGLARAATRTGRAGRRRAALLARLGAASVDEVEARHARHAALKGDLEGMRRALQIHAPGHRHAARPARRGAGTARCAASASACRRRPPPASWTSPRRGRP